MQLPEVEPGLIKLDVRGLLVQRHESPADRLLAGLKVKALILYLATLSDLVYDSRVNFEVSGLGIAFCAVALADHRDVDICVSLERDLDVAARIDRLQVVLFTRGLHPVAH